MSNLPLIITVVVCGVTTSVLSVVAVQFLKKNITKSAEENFSKQSSKLTAINGAIDVLLEQLSKMVPYQEVVDKQASLEEVNKGLAEELETLEKLDASLKEAQDQVDVKEGKQNDIKIHKETSEDFIEELQSNQKELQENLAGIQTQADEYKEKLEQFSVELSLNGMDDASKDIFDSIVLFHGNSTQHFTDLTQLRDQSTSRLTALSEQMAQLENEYRNLVEKELSGDG